MKNVIFTYDTIQNGERGEACAMILVEDAQAWALQSGCFLLARTRRPGPKRWPFTLPRWPRWQPASPHCGRWRTIRKF